MQIIKQHNGFGGGAQIPLRLITHAVGEFVRDRKLDVTLWAPEYETRIELSAHYYITPTGVIIQQRGDHQMAWHAKNHNRDTLGVEWMVPGIHDYDSFVERIKTDWVSKEQFDAGVDLYKYLQKAHGTKVHQRHSDLDPQRKVDPGVGFPWGKLLEAIA